MISRMEWAAGRKLRANAGETLTEVLISVLVIALGMTLFLSAFLASGRMLQQGEEQMAGYYDSRNQLENRPLLMWRAHANNLYTNWLNYYVYQSTPFDLYGTPDFSEI